MISQASGGTHTGRLSSQRAHVPTWQLPAARTNLTASLTRSANCSALQRGTVSSRSAVKAAGLRRANPDSLFQLPAGKADRSAQDSQDGSAVSKPTASRRQLDKFFDMLCYEKDITAKQNFSCCQSCGVSEIRHHAYEGDIGYCFFHQDADTLAEDNHLYLAFSSYKNGSDEDLRVARKVYDAAIACNLPITWDGCTYIRMRIDGFDPEEFADWKYVSPAVINDSGSDDEGDPDLI